MQQVNQSSKHSAVQEGVLALLLRGHEAQQVSSGRLVGQHFNQHAYSPSSQQLHTHTHTHIRHTGACATQEQLRDARSGMLQHWQMLILFWTGHV